MDGSADLRTRLRAVVAHRMETDPAHDLAHLDRVWTNARAIADDQTNMSVLLAASYLHDLVNLPKDDPDRHLASRRSATESQRSRGWTDIPRSIVAIRAAGSSSSAGNSRRSREKAAHKAYWSDPAWALPPSISSGAQ